MTTNAPSEDLQAGRDWLHTAVSLFGQEAYYRSRAASAIASTFVQLAHTSRSMTSMDESSEVTARQLVAFDAIADAADRTGDPTLEAAAERVVRDQAEARPHANHPHAGDPAHPFPYISEMAGARPHDDEHADDCTGCDGPGVVPCAADLVIGPYAMRDGVPIKDLRGGDRG